MRNLANIIALPLMLASLSGCDLLGSKKKAETKVATVTKTSNAATRICGANATYSRLKQAAFDEAKRIRERDTTSLDALADASVVRMENPLLESRDEALGLTVCSGRMILELPPGAGAAFDGRQRLAADVTYSAQAAADGSGTVFKIDGGEPIVYRLAGFDPSRGATRTAAVDPLVVRDAPELPVEDEPIPVPTPPPAEPRAPVSVPVERDFSAERARAAALRQAQAARAAAAREARVAREEAALAREERALAAERSARATRVAEARRVERGEREPAPRDTRVTAATARPSFNCRYARTRSEKLVCGSNDLAERDRRMANVYYRANDRADGPTRRALSASRLRFLAYRDRCDSEACIASAYEDRIAEINDISGE